MPRLLTLISIVSLWAVALPVPASPRQSVDQVAAARIEDPGGVAMRAFYRALDRASRSHRDKTVRVLHYGDSHTAADLLTGELRRDFQRDFGDGGPGFIYALPPWKWYARRGVSLGASAGWQLDGLSSTGERDGAYGISGISASTDRAGERIWVSSDATHFEVYLLEQPGGGTVEVVLDGVSRSTEHLSSSHYEPKYIRVDAATAGLHLLEVRTVEPGRTRVLGFVAERNSAGVVYDALGINGVQAYRPLSWNWNVLESNLDHRDPDLIVVAYGSNEVGDPDFDLAQYEASFAELLARFHRAAPHASILVLGPPDRAARAGGQWETMPGLASIIATQRRIALASGAAFFDQSRAMGGAGSIERWAESEQQLAQKDRVHLTRDGYSIMAGMIYGELMRGYRAVASDPSIRDNRPRETKPRQAPSPVIVVPDEPPAKPKDASETVMEESPPPE